MNDETNNIYTINENGQATYNFDNSKRKKGPLKGILIFLGIVVIIVILGILATSCEGSGDTGNIYPVDDFIARIDVIGPIVPDSPTRSIFDSKEAYSHSWTIKTVEELMKEDSNKGILLYINTPGGAVYETDELYLKIKEYKKKTERPVYAVMGNIAASGGYYISAPCDKIIANRNTWTGSIGVTLGNILDLSGFLDTHGVKVNTITSGANKAMGNTMAPMTEEQRAIFQSIVDEAYEQFAEVVADGRNLEISYVKKIADGRIYTAKQAKEVKLIDEIAGYDEACAMMKKEKGLKDAEIVNMNDEHSGSLFSVFSKFNLSGLKEAVFPKSDIAALNEMLGQNSKIEPKYYCEQLAE